MYRYDDMALAALLMFMPVEAASSLGQPFSERRAFHRRAPFDMTRSVRPRSSRYTASTQYAMLCLPPLICVKAEISES
jgi:hypothetical protein